LPLFCLKKRNLKLEKQEALLKTLRENSSKSKKSKETKKEATFPFSL
jgi:hypothetical protein